MPSDCCVPECHNRKGGHKFPITPERHMQWRIAIKRVDPVSKRLWAPGDNHVVCGDHFKADDYCGGKRRRLKPGVVPSKFTFRGTNQTESIQTDRDRRYDKRNSVPAPTPVNMCDYGIANVNVTITQSAEENSRANVTSEKVKTSIDASVQCSINITKYSIHNFCKKPDAVQYLTGFDDYQHFMWFFGILINTGIKPEQEYIAVALEDQLFLTLMKLRQGFDHKYLAILFEVSVASVSRIFTTWVNFTFHCLKLLYIWPSKKVIQETMPNSFRTTYPTTRIIIDTTEIPIEKPSDINFQQQTFSSYKNRNTLKVLVGITPKGVVSYVSECFGGAASDREIMERSDLYTRASTLFDRGDSIMADRGFLVQDLFAPFDVTVNTPSLLKGRSQLEPNARYADRKVASNRVHVERVIGYAKTYKLLQSPIPYHLLPLSNKIVYI